MQHILQSQYIVVCGYTGIGENGFPAVSTMVSYRYDCCTIVGLERRPCSLNLMLTIYVIEHIFISSSGYILKWSSRFGHSSLVLKKKTLDQTTRRSKEMHSTSAILSIPLLFEWIFLVIFTFCTSKFIDGYLVYNPVSASLYGESTRQVKPIDPKHCNAAF